ncbi:PREDICTED: uncharacterized protein LOC105154615 isoform X1 [Acromyrmex echinatior]|uniref:uncharacterized protein LOC105154615 isoform X1 n=1 Tax=Acromyrmex echinatior TaxID=103372 RepID=UPI000580DC64|nr:PREDICTED: uncharacterized protein LOC105154615 isoform X1 [Acromyrmex echinatior]
MKPRLLRHLYGIFLEVHTDQGRNFESRIYRELSRLLGIKKTRMAKHETTGMIPAELYSVQELYLPIDLLRGSLPEIEEVDSLEGYVGKVKRKFEEIRTNIRERINIKSS